VRVDLSNPLATLTPTLDAAVLQVLAATTAPCTAAEIHRRMARGSDEGVRRVLARLVGQGIVLTHAPARYPLYWLNRNHVAAPLIMALSYLRDIVFTRIHDAVLGWPLAPVHASLFGSFARGEAGADSDIDVLAIRPRRLQEGQAEAWQLQLDTLGESIRSWTGNLAQIVDLDLATLTVMVREKDPIVDAWRSDVVHIAGDRLIDVLRGVR
jgi:hypothetical protein